MLVRLPEAFNAGVLAAFDEPHCRRSEEDERSMDRDNDVTPEREFLRGLPTELAMPDKEVLLGSVVLEGVRKPVRVPGPAEDRLTVGMLGDSAGSPRLLMIGVAEMMGGANFPLLPLLTWLPLLLLPSGKLSPLRAAAMDEDDLRKGFGDGGACVRAVVEEVLLLKVLLVDAATPAAAAVGLAEPLLCPFFKDPTFDSLKTLLGVSCPVPLPFPGDLEASSGREGAPERMDSMSASVTSSPSSTCSSSSSSPSSWFPSALSASSSSSSPLSDAMLEKRASSSVVAGRRSSCQGSAAVTSSIATSWIT